MKKKTNKRTPVENLYYHYFNGVGVSIMKLGEVKKKIAAIIEESAAVEGNGTAVFDALDAKMKALVEEYGEKQAA